MKEDKKLHDEKMADKNQVIKEKEKSARHLETLNGNLQVHCEDLKMDKTDLKNEKNVKLEEMAENF